MHEHNHPHTHDNENEKQTGDEFQAEPLSPGYAYFSNALKVSFTLLKVIMIILLGVFIISGFKRVESNEQALVLRFGKIRGLGDNRIMGPGLKMLWPYPVHEIIRIPSGKTINLSLNQFWYYQRPGEEMDDETTHGYVQPTLNPLIDGYCLVRGEKQGPLIGTSESGDYGILHSKWVLTYQIINPESFYKNCFIDESGLQAGQGYGDVIEQSITPFLENLFSDAVVRTMVNFTIDEAMYERTDGLTKHVEKLLQDRLDKLNSGISVISVQRNRIAVPRQAALAFQAAHSAAQAREKTVSEAKLYYEKTLSETAGPVAIALIKALHEKNPDPNQIDRLWLRLAGRSQEEIADARSYKTKVVETARANADYLQQILPEYRKHPKLVIQRIYKDAMEQIIENADEKIIMQPAQTRGGTEIRVQLNRDPTLKSK